MKTDTWKNEFVKDTTINGIELVFVPQGKYKKGLYCAQDSITYGYWIGKYEVTNLLFYNFIAEALNDSFIFLENNVLYYQYAGDDIVVKDKYRVKMFDDRIFLRNDSILLNTDYENHPVISVTWYGCKAFCDYYDLDLPTEAEWEKAARGDHCLCFPWGNDIDSSFANYFNSNDPFETGTTPVGFYNGKKYGNFQTSDATSVFGCYDMAGNAWEWTLDRYTIHTPYNLGKGGGFNIHTPAFLQVYCISTFGVAENIPSIDVCHLSDGFRVVKRIK